MKKSRNSDKLFPLYKHPTDALPAPNGADFGVWGRCPQQAFFASVLTLALLATSIRNSRYYRLSGIPSYQELGL